MTNTNTNNSYPFITKAQVREAIASGDPAMITQFVCLMQDRTDRRDADPTLKRSGWMSSHDKRGREVSAAARAGELEGEALETACAIVPAYVKQIATELRQQAVANNPDLADSAATFGV